MTAGEAAGFVERLTPAEFKLGFVKLLEWQAQHKKSLVHVSWYLNCLKYERDPRQKENGALRALTAGIGRTDRPASLTPEQEARR